MLIIHIHKKRRDRVHDQIIIFVLADKLRKGYVSHITLGCSKANQQPAIQFVRLFLFRGEQPGFAVGCHGTSCFRLGIFHRDLLVDLIRQRFRDLNAIIIIFDSVVIREKVRGEKHIIITM